jgi:ribosomal protein S14
MKCIRCGKDVKPRRRRDRCPACGRPFAINPARDPFGMTDAEFRDAIRRVSGIGRHCFGARQLWEELNRGRPIPVKGGLGCLPAAGLIVGSVAGVALAAAGGIDGLVVLVIGFKSGLLLSLLGHLLSPERGDKRLARKVSYDVFLAEHLPRWQSVHGPVARLVPEPGPGTPAAAPGVPADGADFSVDRVVVTQHAETAAMLVANGFDVEHACAVLSLDGYPFGTAKAARERLRRNPRLTVFALHDATPEGMQLPFTLREAAWFPERSTLLVVVGLRSASGDYMLRLRVPFRFHKGPRVTLPARLREGLTPMEVSWCEAGYRAELASLRPGPLIRLLQRAVAAVGLPGQPAHTEALRMSEAAGGIVWADRLPAATAAGATPPRGRVSA